MFNCTSLQMTATSLTLSSGRWCIKTDRSDHPKIKIRCTTACATADGAQLAPAEVSHIFRMLYKYPSVPTHYLPGTRQTSRNGITIT